MKLVDKFLYFSSSISLTESDMKIHLAKAWTAIDRLSYASLTYTMKKRMQFLPSSSCVNCIMWMHHIDADKCIKKKLDGNCTRMPWAILNKSWKQHPTKQQLYSHKSPVSKIIQIRQTRHAGQCWRNKDELINDVLQWTPPPFTWTFHRWLTNKNLHATALYRHRMLSRRPVGSSGW